VLPLNLPITYKLFTPPVTTERQISITQFEINS
jgi:hypothetical protein